MYLRRQSGFWELPLKGLRESEVRELVTILAEHEVPQPLVLALHQETEGNPFFIQETLRHLIETEASIRRKAAGPARPPPSPTSACRRAYGTSWSDGWPGCRATAVVYSRWAPCSAAASASR
jgi:hypothetical protein